MHYARARARTVQEASSRCMQKMSRMQRHMHVMCTLVETLPRQQPETNSNEESSDIVRLHARSNWPVALPRLQKPTAPNRLRWSRAETTSRARLDVARTMAQTAPPGSRGRTGAQALSVPLSSSTATASAERTYHHAQCEGGRTSGRPRDAPRNETHTMQFTANLPALCAAALAKCKCNS